MKRKLIKKYLKDLNEVSLAVIITGIALGCGLSVINEILSGFNIFADLSWNDLTEHRYEILDQLIAEHYLLK